MRNNLWGHVAGLAIDDNLSELGGPGRSMELIGTPGLGVGPFRNAHLEPERRLTSRCSRRAGMTAFEVFGLSSRPRC